eukprot:TRINITY_DN54583_c0_g1_i1.p1 TRINITY_DN54583_c0_g1~~TRINITY_DN54583_c0_g1_i1.p1  ORF type:complete len:874 (-),score=126.95 TRINITY_DN54583_c0_g1_i1:76-2697(-)
MTLSLILLAFPPLCVAWQSSATQDSFYTFQEFYTDAQYGPDFGYYSTGRILHDAGPEAARHEFFNSYTTLPMGLSPYFGQLIGDRIVGMWRAMGRPGSFVVMEFGGGTGVLARDILRHCRRSHPDFYLALHRYVIGERSQALRGAQKQTGADFYAGGTGKLLVVEADARVNASSLRGLVEKQIGQPVRGIVLSNELLDEFDPVLLRIVWRRGAPPTAEQCLSCSVFREGYVLHRIDDSAMSALLRQTWEASPEQSGANVESHLETLRWEGRMLACGLMENAHLKRLVEEIVALLTPEERRQCSPLQVCCLPFVLAVDLMLQQDQGSIQPPRPLPYLTMVDTVLRRYRDQFNRTNGTVLLSKDRYRELRRAATSLGRETEFALLVGGSQLPGRIRTDQVFFGLRQSRCDELRGWRARHAERFAAAARLRSESAPHFDRLGLHNRVEHLKLVARPGEAAFAHQTSKLIDDGFLLTLDYGSDADALTWRSLLHPNFDGIHIMDGRQETADVCTQVSYLECPGLQDLTTFVDFTEVAEAGRTLGGWKTRAFGPIFYLEISHDPWLPAPSMHIIERSGGPRTVGIHSWYRKAEGEQWASFKALVQHRGSIGGDWTLGPPNFSWPLEVPPRFLRSPSPCWARDLTKPPLAALIAKSTEGTSDGSADQVASLSKSFDKLLSSRNDMATAVDEEHANQTQAYRDLHLALLLADYWLEVVKKSSPLGGPPTCTSSLADGGSVPTSAVPTEILSDPVQLSAAVRSLATSRRVPEMLGEHMFGRVLSRLVDEVFFGNLNGSRSEPYVCVVAEFVKESCRGSWQQGVDGLTADGSGERTASVVSGNLAASAAGENDADYGEYADIDGGAGAGDDTALKPVASASL